MDIDTVDCYMHSTRAKDVVDAFPLAFVAIRAFDTIYATGILRQIPYAMLLTDALHDTAISILVKIACHQYAGIGRGGIYRIYGITQPTSHCLTKRAAVTLAAKTAGGVDNKDV